MGVHASCCAAGGGNKSLPPGWARGFTTDDAAGEEAAKVDCSDVITQEPALKVQPEVAPAAGEEPSVPLTKDLEEPAADAPGATGQKSLYDRIGGEAAVEAAVEQFYGKLVADESLAPIFASSDMASLKGMQKKFLTLAFGGPAEYSGKSMKDAHHGKGITNDQFGAVAGHLSTTLTQLGVPGPEHDEVMAIAASTQGDIVEASLYDRLGGEAAVDAAVEQFYEKLLADESLASMFANSDMAGLKGMQKKFLTLAFGGPADYSGKSMKDAHQGKGITNDHFGAVAGHLSATLTQLGVPGPEHDEVMAIAASTQGDIVEKSVFDRLGGAAAVDAAVELFYGKLLADATLAPMFASSDMDSLKAMQKKFLTVAFGGPAEYTGKSLKAAHKGKGITDVHFGAVAAHLSTTLKELGVPSAEHDLVMMIAASTKADIVEQKPKASAKGKVKSSEVKSKSTAKAKDKTADKAAPDKPKAKPADAAKAADASKEKSGEKAAEAEQSPAQDEPDKDKEKDQKRKSVAAPPAGGAVEEDEKAALKRRAEEWKKMSKADQTEKGGQLRQAAKDGNLAVLEKLLNACVSPEAEDKDGWTALHIAAQGGSKEMVKKLLEYGADPLTALKLGEYGNTALHFAARGGHKSVCKLLVKKGKKALTMKNNEKKTPGQMATGDLAEWFEDL